MFRRGAACVLLLAATSACSHAVSMTAVRDAQLVARVKTALINDPKLGINPIEVHVTGGIVSLTGRVESAADVDHAVQIARSVPGVADVLSDLRIGPSEVVPPAPDGLRGAIVDDELQESAPGWLAVGVSVGRSTPASGVLAARWKGGPLVRFGSGRGLGAAVGFGWFSAEWRAQTSAAPIGRINVRPVLGGLAYGFQGEGRSLSLSLLGGVAFNSLSLPEVLAEQQIPLGVANSLAVRPGLSFWFDISRRFAVNVGGSYLVTRPRVRLLENGQPATRSLRADAMLVNTGLVYKIF
jgi:hyperosmotically inducible protein